jgi:hypothetical protein
MATFLVSGTGFDSVYVVDTDYKCAFDGVAYNGSYISDSLMQCDFPFFQHEGITNESLVNTSSLNSSYSYSLEISIDGRTFTRSLAITTVDLSFNCQTSITSVPTDTTAITSVTDDDDDEDEIIIGVVIGLFLLLLLLWCLWPLLVGVAPKPKKEAAAAAASIPMVAATTVAAPDPPVEPEPTPAAVPEPGATATKQWKTVDTSSYIWATSGGGAGPMPTQWGNLGATDMAPVGTDAKTRDVEGPVEPTTVAAPAAPAAPTPAPEPKEDLPEFKPAAPRQSCCATFCGSIAACYASCAALRPQPKVKQLETSNI